MPPNKPYYKSDRRSAEEMGATNTEKKTSAPPLRATRPLFFCVCNTFVVLAVVKVVTMIAVVVLVGAVEVLKITAVIEAVAVVVLHMPKKSGSV